MICKKCNFQNEETAKFCKNCGVELTNNEKTMKKGLGWGIAGFLVSLLILLLSIWQLTYRTEIFDNKGFDGEFNGVPIILLGFFLSLYALLKNRKNKIAIAGITLSVVAFIVVCMMIYAIHVLPTIR